MPILCHGRNFMVTSHKSDLHSRLLVICQYLEVYEYDIDFQPVLSIANLRQSASSLFPLFIRQPAVHS